ncbi:hypothetical protein [Pseudomonas sp.]|uniref:hypothetical protein n=1 Tax=Pseudomonas sp. TaxID=306 RepID=UPI00258C35A5|nr:hypothetical protein [Pseudomonas sp.]
MKNLSIVLFIAAVACLGYGVFKNLIDTAGYIGGTGTMSNNSYYQLSMALAGLAIAAELILSRRTA